MKLSAACSAIVLIVSFSSCVPVTPPDPKRIDEVRPIPPVLKGMSYTIQRRDLESSLTRSAENAIRLVPVFQNISNTQTFEYRLFDVRPKSAYSLLGLRNSDVIIAADGFLIKKPDQFVQYVQLLLKEDEANIEIRRDGTSLLLKYFFVPAVKVKAPVQQVPSVAKESDRPRMR